MVFGLGPFFAVWADGVDSCIEVVGIYAGLKERAEIGSKTGE